MGNRINNGFANYFRRYLVSPGCLNALGAGSYSKVNLGEHKINRLIYQIEDRSLVNSVERDGFRYLYAMKMGALDFRGNKETLRLFSK